MNVRMAAAGAVLLLGVVRLSAESPQAVNPPRPVGDIERLDPTFDQLVPHSSRLEVVAEGFEWSEGPVWLPKQQRLIFSDIPRNTIFSWSAVDGLQTYLRPSGFTATAARGGEMGSNGLALDLDGRLLLCQHGDRRVARMVPGVADPEPQYQTVAEAYEGRRFHSPNDLVVHSSGSIFFTDPPYGLERQLEDPARELDFQGVYRVDPDGSVTLLVSDLARPNGIALSPDERTLYVAQSHQPKKILMAYSVEEDLTVARGRVLFDANELGRQRKGSPDGLKVDEQGNLFVTGPGGVLVLNSEGKHLGSLLPGQLTANCGFGDDGRTLYLTSDPYLCRIRLTTRGLGFPTPATPTHP